LLKGYVLSQISPKKALNQALNDYNNHHITYRELMCIEACALEAMGKMEQANQVVERLFKIEKSYIPSCDPYFHLISVLRH